MTFAVDIPFAELSAWQSAWASAMRDELAFGPFQFDGWAAYERERPLLAPHDPIQVLGAWPDEGSVLQYRPLLEEMLVAFQTPLDAQPSITSLGRVPLADVAALRTMVRDGSDAQAVLARVNERTVRSELPSNPTIGRDPVWVDGRETLELSYRAVAETFDAPKPETVPGSPAHAYQWAGEWGLRLGPPVGIADDGFPVFEPVGFKDGTRVEDVRVTVGQRTSAAPAHVDVYRRVGDGSWEWSASVGTPVELQRLASPVVGVPEPELTQVTSLQQRMMP